MKLFTKKTIAILLSALIVMGSIAIASFAAAKDGTFTTKTVFYNEDGSKNSANSGVLYAKKGDRVKAVISITSDYYVGSFQVLFEYDSKMLSFDTDTYGMDREFPTGQFCDLANTTGTVLLSEVSGSGYNTTGLPVDSNKEIILFNIHDRYIVQQYDNTTAFHVWFKVRDDIQVTDEGRMMSSNAFTCSSSSPDYPNDINQIDESLCSDPSVVVNQTTVAANPSKVYTPYQYACTVVSTSDVVKVQGSAKFDPNGTVDGTAVAGTISGLTAGAVKTVTGWYGENIAASDIPAKTDVTAPTGYEFKGWSLDGAATLTDAQISAEGYGEPTTFKAVYKAAPFTITYDPNGGSLSNPSDSPKTVAFGAALPASEPTVTREGYNPNGWDWFNSANESISKPTTMPADNLTAKAKWTAIDYTLTWDYNDNGATTADTETHNVGDSFTTKADPSWGAHTFNGWFDADGKTPADYANQMPAKDLTFKATWDNFVLTVDLDGGSFPTGVTDPTGEYEDSASVPAPADPVKEGYTFTGWDTTWDAEHPIVMDNNKTVKATWSVNKYTITYNPNGGELADPTVSPASVQYDAALPADPEVSKTGSTFSGWEWYDAADNKLDAKPEKMPAGNLTAKAIWDGIDYTVTFVDEDGTTELGKVTGKYGETVTPIANPTKEGYDFDKWDPEVPATFSEDVTVKAVYKAKKYNLTVDLDGGKFENDADNPAGEYDYNTSVAKPASDPVREGFNFKGWSPAFPVVMTKDTTVKALWAGTTTITLNPDGGKKPDGTAYEPIIIESDSKDYPDIPDPVLDGKEFAGWFWKDGTGATHQYDFTKTPEENIGGPVSGDLPLTAVYLTEHTVTYKVDGTEVKTATVLTGGDISATVPADPTKEGYVFKGWKDADGKKPTDYAAMPDKDLVFNAEFAEKEPDKYTYKFVDRGNTIESGQLYAGDPIPTPETPSRFGYKFAGWKPEVPTYMPEGDITFEAQWESDVSFLPLIIGGAVVAGGVVAGVAAANTALIAGGAVVGGIVAVAIAANTYKVTYLVDGNVYRVFYILRGTKVIVPKDPTKDGCTFQGWDAEIPETMPDHDLVFNAKFSGSASGNNSSTGSAVVSDVPATGSASAGLAVFAVISSACAAAYVMNKRKHS